MNPDHESLDKIYIKAQTLRTFAVHDPHSFVLNTLCLSDFDADLVQAFIQSFQRIDDDAQKIARWEVSVSSVIRDATANDDEIVREVTRIMSSMKQPTSNAFVRCLNALTLEGRQKVYAYLDNIQFGEPDDFKAEIASSRDTFLARLEKWGRDT